MTTKIDPISAATAVASIIFGPDLAHYIGPYSVILLASTAGAGWALGRHPPLGSRTGAVLFFMRLNVLALLLTVPLAAGATAMFGNVEQHLLLGPIALAIGAIGNDWPRVGQWLLKRLGRLFERRIGVDSSDTKIGD